MSVTTALYIVTFALIGFFLFSWRLMKSVSAKNKKIADLEKMVDKLKAGVYLDSGNE